MRVKTDRLQKFLLGAALIAALGWNLAHAAEVRGVQVAQGPAGTRAEIVLDSAATDYRLISLASPERLVVDLPAATLRTNAGFSAPAGVVRAVRVGKPEFGVVRIVFDLSQPVAALRPQLEPAPLPAG
ncbi:MAG: AMIN domain-containing protein, partial [Lysobacter sp.]